ncbi:MAG: hypothetical protein AAF378_19910 [Cyanobacteria bacterium P01_A01_bin.84]
MDTQSQELHYPNISQLSLGMTPEEMITEGYAWVDDFYNPDEEKWKEETQEQTATEKKDTSTSIDEGYNQEELEF